MALAELLHALEADAQAESGAILAAATAEAAQIDAETARLRGEQVSGALAAFAAERRAACDAELTAATRSARAEILAARAAMLDRVRAAVLGELPALLAADPALGPAVIAAALACVGDESGTLRAAPPLAELARAAAPPSIRIETDPAVTTGVVIELAAGTRIDATLAALLDRAWPQLACEALILERAR
jgi:vacuolar-type H+-ATPase subunit E/Vma4